MTVPATAPPTSPGSDEYASAYADYVSRVPPGDVVVRLGSQILETAVLLRPVDPARARYRYAPGKWSVVQIVGHLCDTERIMAYRALRIARQDQTPLPGFDENAYTPAGGFEERALADVLAEFEAVRAATVALFAGLPAGAWTRWGTASGHPITVRALAYIVAGHELHHVEVLRTRYGLGAAART